MERATGRSVHSSFLDSAQADFKLFILRKWPPVEQLLVSPSGELPNRRVVWEICEHAMGVRSEGGFVDP